jgi:hypothetical protein
MRIPIILIVFMLMEIPFSGNPQFLSKLDATKKDAIFTTYAAPMERSSYKTDQGYQFMWYDDEGGVEFISNAGLNMGIEWTAGNETHLQLNEFYKEPVITTSYSDLVRYYYYPFRDIRVEVFFDVYSSTQAIEDIRITNESGFTKEIGLHPYLYFAADDTLNDITHETPYDFYTFHVRKKRDGWMTEHKIPLTEHLTGFLLNNMQPDSVQSFVLQRISEKGSKTDPFHGIKRSILKQKRNVGILKGMIISRTLRLEKGESTHFRLAAGLEDAGIRIPVLYRKADPLLGLNLNKLISEDEKVYAKIPPVRLESVNSQGSLPTRDLEMFYWSCFSLLRQCMMPPEGKCGFNYYIFSREPEWGWGYGGQVFHESLSMLAYAFMDPVGAMNSQRVYFQRQHEDGYINYRTGPYLDETIEYNGKLTTSAPWLSYEDLEIYKVTGDRQFLKESYNSGKKFYEYYTVQRDSNKNGLCEWGAEAELESVRDARVAVWDKVGWPSNFEGVDVNSMLVKEANSLAEMAEISGLTEDAKKWREEVKNRTDLINKYMWDNRSGFYYNINRDDQSFTFRKPDDLKIKEIPGFLPLWAGVCDSVTGKTLVQTMKDPEEFWRPFGVPSLSAKDDYYNPIGYWNGPVWVQWDYLVFRGLLDYGYKKEAEELAFKVLDNMIWHFKNDHVFWEFYSADDRQAGWNKTYIWAGLAARFLIDLDFSTQQSHRVAESQSH